MTKADPRIQITKKPLDPVVTMIVPGRRALGETWSKVTVGIDHDKDDWGVEREDTTAPADNSPIFVPAMGNLSVEMADYILEHSRAKAPERAKQGKGGYTTAELSELFHDYMEEKLVRLQRKSTYGAGGHFQRD